MGVEMNRLFRPDIPSGRLSLGADKRLHWGLHTVPLIPVPHNMLF